MGHTMWIVSQEISFWGVPNGGKMYQAKKKEKSDKKLAEEAKQMEKSEVERKGTEMIKKQTELWII